MSRVGKYCAVALGALGLAGCATHDYATRAYVDQRVNAVQAQVNQLRGQVQVNDARLAALERCSREALQRAMAAGRLQRGRIDYSMVLSDASVGFPTDRWELSPRAQSILADFAARLRGANRDLYIEIQGYTDDTGAPDYNYGLGWDRAQAVRDFLYQQGVPWNRMATISYGESRPVASNDTAEGRAQNRRVELVVLE